jgi:hypothetical protein
MPDDTFAIRELEDRDLPALARILAEGFRRHSLGFWEDRLRLIADRDRAPGTQKYGYGIEANGLQGAALTLGSLHGSPESPQTVVNISSWTVRPSHRGPPAKELYRHASSFSGFTYSNLSAAAHTLKTITNFGFRESTAGQVLAVGVRKIPGSLRRIVPLHGAASAGLTPDKVALMRYHEGRGCLSFCLELEDRLAPFIFLRRRIKPGIPVAQLIYCERMSDLQENSRSIYFAVLARGYIALLVDASGPIPGLKGRYFPGKAAKYYKGPALPYAVDHTYSEMVYIGF